LEHDHVVGTVEVTIAAASAAEAKKIAWESCDIKVRKPPALTMEDA